MISLFFRKFYAVMGTGERWGRRGLEQMPGWGRHLADAWEACQGHGESLQADESCLLCFGGWLKGTKESASQSRYKTGACSKGQLSLAKETSRRKGGHLWSHLPFLSPRSCRPVASMYQLSCPSFLSGSWLYSWGVIKENPILEVKNRSEMRRWSVGFNMDTHVIVTSSAGRINRLMLSCT